MDRTIKVLVLNNEVEAELLDGLLNERNIPHMIRSYHDSAMDGIWQTYEGWGVVQAPEEYKEEIQEIYNGMSQNHEMIQ